MKKMTLAMLVATSACAACAAHRDPSPSREPVAMPTALDGPWDPARVTALVESARSARRDGDLATAERRCYTVFLTVDRDALDAYDAYADALRIADSPTAPVVRKQAVRLRETKRAQGGGSRPGSAYLGFVPADGLDAYADWLGRSGQVDAAKRIRALAGAYRQVQQAQFERTVRFQRGEDPRGIC